MKDLTMNFKNMSVGQLLGVRAQVEDALANKRDELHAQLSQIGGRAGGGARRSSGKRGVVAPKYRHPKTGETWSGRGGTVRWLAAEIKAGKKKEDFLISASGKKAAKRGRKKGQARK